MKTIIAILNFYFYTFISHYEQTKEYGFRIHGLQMAIKAHIPQLYKK